MKVFKVIFKGEDENISQLNLTFKSILNDKPIKINPQIILNIKKLGEISKNVLIFQNISEVIPYGSTLNYSFNYFFVILYIIKENKIKRGFLIGNIKKIGDILVGIWPFNNSDTFYDLENFISQLTDLINNPHKYSNICLIN
ncbi:MAG: hypothetical protein ACTSVV_02155 [Promethearchaeota archaeon]